MRKAGRKPLVGRIYLAIFVKRPERRKSWKGGSCSRVRADDTLSASGICYSLKDSNFLEKIQQRHRSHYRECNQDSVNTCWIGLLTHWHQIFLQSTETYT